MAGGDDRKKDRLTPRQLERRERIVSAAQALVAQRGHDAVTMRTIAEASGTVEKTLYNIFGSKDRLIAAVARDRSASLFQAAVDAAPAGGWAMLHSFARLASELTLADPPMSRALAAIVVDHGDLVGLNDIYTGRVASALDQMIGEGMIAPPPSRAAVIRQIRLGIVSAVLFWAKGEISDRELGPYIFVKMGEPFLPLTLGEKGMPIWRDVKAAQQMLARLHPDEPPSNL